MERTFETRLSTFRKSISNYKYYIDFDTVYRNAEKYKDELNLLDWLIKCDDVENEFIRIITKYPNVLHCIPTLLAVRESEIFVLDSWKEYCYDFSNKNYTPEQYAVFMKETWLFDLFKNHLIGKCYDYVLWVECWLNSNARKNRWGHLMEDLVEDFIQKAGFKKDVNYFKEMYTSDMEKMFWIDLTPITNEQKTEKRFDYVVKTPNCVYAIETNFYASWGSKLNETARSYKMIAEESKNIKWFKFVWFTDWEWWISARNNLRETFDVLPTMYNINDMNNWIMREAFK